MNTTIDIDLFDSSNNNFVSCQTPIFVVSYNKLFLSVHFRNFPQKYFSFIHSIIYSYRVPLNIVVIHELFNEAISGWPTSNAHNSMSLYIIHVLQFFCAYNFMLLSETSFEVYVISFYFTFEVTDFFFEFSDVGTKRKSLITLSAGIVGHPYFFGTSIDQKLMSIAESNYRKSQLIFIDVEFNILLLGICYLCEDYYH